SGLERAAARGTGWGRAEGLPQSPVTNRRGCDRRAQAMGLKRAFAVLGTALVLSGCVNSSVQQWALLGAASGAATGAGAGFLISEPDLLGSPATPETGDVAIDSNAGIVGGLVVGAVFGAIIGSIVGHHRYDPVEEAYEEQLEAQLTLTGGDGEPGEFSDEDLGVDLGDLEGLEGDDEEEGSDDGDESLEGDAEPSAGAADDDEPGDPDSEGSEDEDL
ncbi:MAG: hypothetical protein OXU20_26630, partial [Myxococcales bacterium]|nr:hypothetical protein [Myxococcales bacterium]MDD9967805.1 hypothetical protein [Myxococcales bacterium]